MQEIKSDIIPWEQIEAVANWLNYGSGVPEVSAGLLKFSGKFPSGTMSYAGTCYRAFGINPVHVKNLLNGKAIKHRPLESWTSSIEGIKNFLSYTYGGSSTAEYEDYIVVILKNKPLNNEVFLNINKLFSNTKWNRSIEYWENMGKHFNEGLDFGGGAEEEIILAKKQFVLSDIFDTNNVDPAPIKQQLIDFIA